MKSPFAEYTDTELLGKFLLCDNGCVYGPVLTVTRADASSSPLIYVEPGDADYIIVNMNDAALRRYAKNGITVNKVLEVWTNPATVFNYKRNSREPVELNGYQEVDVELLNTVNREYIAHSIKRNICAQLAESLWTSNVLFLSKHLHTPYRVRYSYTLLCHRTDPVEDDFFIKIPDYVPPLAWNLRRGGT